MGSKHSPKQHRRRRRRHTVNVSSTSTNEQNHQSCPTNPHHRATVIDAIESPLKYIVPYIETSNRSGDSCDDSVASSISSPSMSDWSLLLMIKHKAKEKRMKKIQQTSPGNGKNSPISPRRPRRIEPIDNDDDNDLPPCLPDIMLSFPGTAQCNLEQRKIHSIDKETKKKERRRRHSICTPSLNHTPSSRWGTALERYQQESKKDVMHKEGEHQKKKIDQSNKSNSNKSRRSKDQNSKDHISPLVHKPSIHRRRSVGDVPIKQVHFAKTSTSGTSKTTSFSSSSDDSCSTSSSKSSDSASTYLYKQACQDVKLLNMKVPLETTRRSNDLKGSLFYISAEYDTSSVSSLDTSSVLSAACTENDWNLLQDARKSLGGVSMEVTRTRRHSIKE